MRRRETIFNGATSCHLNLIKFVLLCIYLYCIVVMYELFLYAKYSKFTQVSVINPADHWCN
jgi:hypothetical protein